MDKVFAASQSVRTAATSASAAYSTTIDESDPVNKVSLWIVHLYASKTTLVLSASVSAAFDGWFSDIICGSITSLPHNSIRNCSQEHVIFCSCFSLFGFVCTTFLLFTEKDGSRHSHG